MGSTPDEAAGSTEARSSPRSSRLGLRSVTSTLKYPTSSS